MKDHAAILIKKDNQFLFVKRSEKKKTLPGIWSFPSGTKEENEEIIQTAEREALEELGVKVKAEEIMTTKELSEFGVKLHFVVCSIVSGKPSIFDYDEIAEIDWLTINDFFEKYTDDEIGHGLVFLRKNPQLWTDF